MGNNLPAGLQVLTVDDEFWHLVQNVRTLGKAVSGGETRVQTPATRFRFTGTLSCRYEDMRYWKAWLAQHQGGLLPDMFGPSGEHISTSLIGTTVYAYTDTTTFTDGFGFVDGGDPLVATAAVAKGAILVVVGSDSAFTAPELGQYLSFAGRMHITRRVVALAGGTFSLEIWPPLRTAIPHNMQLDAKPRCRMRITDPEGGSTPWGFSETYVRWDVEFIEFPPPNSDVAVPYTTLEQEYPV
jgi:hypothetical protein